jgi:hypothetical protein
VGVLNSAKWVTETYPNVSIKVVTDSSWFINFRDSINQEFGAISENKLSQSSPLSGILSTQEACTNTRLGYPCCLSAQCLLTENSDTTGEPYFPREVPIFMLQSLYDLLILSNSLSRLGPVVTDLHDTANLGLQFLMAIGEYGGEMNNSLTATATANIEPPPKLSYYATQCFQHVYFATSTLRGDQGLLGSEVIELSSDMTTVRHRIQSGVWNGPLLGYHEGQGYTPSRAIRYWYENVSGTEERVTFRDLCSGPHCSKVCPEQIVLEAESKAEAWSVGVRITVAATVLLVAAVSLMMKVKTYIQL